MHKNKYNKLNSKMQGQSHLTQETEKYYSLNFIKPLYGHHVFVQQRKNPLQLLFESLFVVR